MKHKLNRMIAMMLAVVLSFSMLLIPVEAASFRDVSDRAWYRAAVDYVHEKGWMNGVSETAFAPNTEVTRGMFVTVLARVAEADTDSSNPAFVDTPAGKWYTGAAAWAAEHGIVSGVGANRFAPNRSISRQDLCTMLYRFIEAQGLELEANADRTFADMGSVSGYARQPVGFCAAAGLVSGFEDGTFRPKSTATRAQVAAILMRLDKLVNGEEAPSEPMPAQSFEGGEQEGMNVSIQAPEGALPENTNMTVSPVTDEATLASLSEKVSGDLVAAADISFSKDGAELEPQAPVEVRIALEGLENVQNPVVYHFKADGTAEPVAAELVSLTRAASSKVLRFYASDFSVYAVYDVEGNENVKLTVVFHANDQIINKQIIRKAQLEDAGNLNPIFDPGVPNISTTESFEGWYLGTASNGSYNESNTGVSVAEINAYYKAHVPAADTTVHYYAMVYPVLYVVYHDQNGAVLMTESYHKNGSNQASVTIDWPYVPFTEGYTFTGWTPDIAQMGDAPTYSASPTVYRNGQTSTISATLNLYPYVKVGHWLSFDNNLEQNNTKNGFNDPTTASYTAPVFAASGVNPTRPTDPERPGYTFGGWYDNINLSGSQFNFNTPLTADTTLYAKWNPSSTTYTIVYWTQVRTDDKNAADANKHYEYYKSSSARSATSCSSVRINKSDSGTTADNRLGGNGTNASDIGEMGFGFQYNSNNTASKNGLSSDTGTVKVRGDGGTIINVYYDRKTITYTFKTSSYGSGTTYSGLFQSDLSPVQDAGNGYLWFCTDINAYIGQKVANFTYPGTYRDSYTLQKQQDTSTSYKTIHEMVQGLNGTELSGTWNEGFTLKITDAQPVASIPIDLFPGFTGYRYNMSSNNPTGSGSGKFPQGTGSNLQIAYSYTYSNYNRIPYITGQDAYVYFSRNQYVFTYRSNNEDLNPQTMYYGATLTGLKDYVPTNGPDDCFFDGWYLDSGLVQPFDFNSYMPNANKIIYAKWTPKKYRVILNYDPESLGVTAGSGAQASFLVNAGEQIDRNALGNFTCDGKRLMGWYTDPEFKHAFNPESLIYDTVSDVNTYYGEKMPGETDAAYMARMNGATRTGPDSITNATWDDRWDTDNPDSYAVQRTVRGQLQLYALWRADPKGVVGMHVTYLGDNGNDTGYFNVTDHPHTWKDPDLYYTDHSWAYAQPASVPDRPADQQFLYWEILDHEGQPTGRKVYPGQLFEILFDDAYQGTEPPTNCEHTVREYVEAVAPTCETAGNSGHYRCTNCGRRFATDDPSNTTVINPTIPALGHDWTGKTYTWDSTVTPWTCTATATCSRNPAHTLSETVNGVWYVDTRPNGQSAGSGHYEASFTNTSVFTAQTSSPVEIPRLTEVTVSFVVPTGVDSVADVPAEPGSSITLPSAGAPSGSTFLGWTNAPVSNASSAPSYSASGTDFTVPDEGATLYALYKRSETKFDLVTSAPSSWTGNYVITAGSDSSMYVLKGLSGITSYQSSNSGGHATLSASGITLDGSSLKNVTDVYVFVAEVATGSYYTLKNKSTGTWLDCYFSTLESYSYNDSPTTINWTLGYDTSSSYTTAVPRSSNSSKLSWAGSYFYVNSSQNSTRKIQFWKESSGTYYYTGSASGTSAVIGETESIGDAGLTANVNQTLDTAVLELVSYTSSKPVREGEEQTEYNIFLRAVYGRYNPDATTYINWYANNGTSYHNGAGSRYQSTSTSHPLTPTKLDYNEEVPIPTPSTFEGDNGGTLYWGGHEFLGWARVPVTGSGSDGTAQTLTADDLYLKWNGSRYEYNPHSDKESEANGWVTLTSGNVFADGDLPHYDMYAVWGPGCFYVLHSATGKLEAIPVTINHSGSGTGTTSVVAPFDLTALVSSGHLYGGYYTSYGGVSASAVDAAVNEYERNSAQTAWTTDAGTSRMTYTCTDANASFDPYTGATSTSSRNDGAKFWTKTDAYKPASGATEQQIADINGKTMRPVSGKVYYLKEVPEAYLAPKFQYVYDTAQNNNILNLFMLSVVDDSYYSKIGFKLAENYLDYARAASSSITVKTTLAKSFSVVQKGNGTTPEREYKVVPSDFTDVSAGLISVLKLDDYIVAGKQFTMLPSWKTLDGVTVEGNHAIGITITALNELVYVTLRP